MSAEIIINKLHNKCLRCGRKLKTEEAKILGYGKVCWEKYNADVHFKKLFDMEKEE